MNDIVYIHPDYPYITVQSVDFFFDDKAESRMSAISAPEGMKAVLYVEDFPATMRNAQELVYHKTLEDANAIANHRR